MENISRGVEFLSIWYRNLLATSAERQISREIMKSLSIELELVTGWLT
jgi:hypothetical protein